MRENCYLNRLDNLFERLQETRERPSFEESAEINGGM